GRFREIHWTQGDASEGRCKWIAMPGRLRDWDQLGQHFALPRGEHRVSPEAFSLAHFLPLTNGWHMREARRAPVEPVAGVHREDLVLKARLDAAFSVWMSDAAAWDPMRSDDPVDAAEAGWRAVAAGDAGRALALFERSLELAPRQPEIAREVRRLLAQREEGGAW
ncbi:MAG: hypothetical protein ACR2J8_02415, partial [Thermomicrobiales bacterium]